MRFSTSIRLLVVCLALGIVASIGLMWWQQGQNGFQDLPPQSGELVDWVDRGISEEDLAREQGRIQELETKISEQRSKGERDISLILQLGNAYYGIGELAKATTQYEDILSTHPADPPALENLGQTQLERGDYAGAERSWRAALSASPYEQTYLKLADLLVEHMPNRQAEVKTLLEDAIATLGQQPNLLVRLGRWYADNGDYDNAISHYQVASRLAPENEVLLEEIEELKRLRAAQ